MHKMVNLVCGFCGKSFQKRETEHKRCLSRGLKSSFCSRQCCNSRGTDVYKQRFSKDNPSPYDISKHSVRDIYSPFRPHFNSIKSRCNRSEGRLEYSITIEDLKEIWDKQDGICPYTGVQLVNHLATANKTHHTERGPYRASVDRIDSTKGYTKDNIQFIALIAQYAKNDWDETELLEFCKKVVAYDTNK